VVVAAAEATVIEGSVEEVQAVKPSMSSRMFRLSLSFFISSALHELYTGD
jgi:hypothetical protein